jgi:hypothetical protein
LDNPWNDATTTLARQTASLKSWEYSAARQIFSKQNPNISLDGPVRFQRVKAKQFGKRCFSEWPPENDLKNRIAGDRRFVKILSRGAAIALALASLSRLREWEGWRQYRSGGVAIAVLAVKAKPPSAVASRALTAALADGRWPPCPFGARSRPSGRIAHQMDMEAKTPRRRDAVTPKAPKRSGGVA